MPLVSLNTVNRWYRKDSWVYRNFTYLFKNPLWDTEVPKGFSLCPYFWLAIFSMTLFRVFVGTTLFIRWGFKPFGGLLNKLDGFFRNTFNIQTSVPAVPTFFVCLVTGVILAVLGLIGFGGYSVVASYVAVEALPALLLPISLAAVAIPCWLYYGEHKYSSTRCKVENYLRLATIVALGLGICTMGSELWVVVSEILTFAWWALSELLKFIFIAVPVGIWDGIKFIAGWIWTGVVVSSYWIMIIVGGLAIAGAFAWLFDKFIPTQPVPPRTEKTENNDVESLAEQFLNSIANRVFEYDDYYRHNKRDRNYWKNHIWNIPEAVALAYEHARKLNQEMSPEDMKRASDAAIATLKFELEQERKSQEVWDAKCQKFSTTAGNIFRFIWRPFGFVIKRLVWIFKEIWTFLCLMFSLLKARKQGACPYLKFEDAPKR